MAIWGIVKKWICSNLEIDHNMCNLMEWSQIYKMRHVVFHKALFLAPNCSLAILAMRGMIDSILYADDANVFFIKMKILI